MTMTMNVDLDKTRNTQLSCTDALFSLLPAMSAGNLEKSDDKQGPSACDTWDAMVVT